jgi:Zn-dependent M28 family amino/carboxypeptidase
MFSMPGESHQGEQLPPLTDKQRDLKQQLQKDVERLAGEIGTRSVAYPEAYARSQRYIETRLEEAGYTLQTQPVDVGTDTAYNVVGTLEGSEKPEEVIVVGAHYDTASSTAGADDNASGTAGVLTIAQRFQGRSPDRTLRFILFANEEPPYFQTPKMGSYRYAETAASEEENIVAMISLEMLGYYSSKSDSQSYPPGLGLFYPSKGNFLAFVGKLGQRSFVAELTSTFRSCSRVPSFGIAAPTFLPGISLSDHWSFWQHGFPALMVTDTAFFRNPHYHRLSDVPRTLDYDTFARVVDGIDCLLKTIAD